MKHNHQTGILNAGITCQNRYRNHLSQLLKAVTLSFFFILSSALLQAQTPFSHQVGHSGQPLMDNGMQRVHTNRIVLYMYPGETRTLAMPESAINSYVRFYQYDTDGDIVIGSSNTWGNQLHPNKGKYVTNYGATIDYTAPATLPASGIVTELAYDLSYYNDYVMENDIVVIEPTLSTRIIFEIRPAAEMKAKLDTCPNTNGAIDGKYLEHYHLLAPAGNVLTFGPAFPYTSNSDYFIGTSTRVTSGTWFYNGVQMAQQPNITRNQFISQTITTPGLHVYTLISSSGHGLCKYTIEVKDINTIGPKGPDPLVSYQSILSDYKYVAGINFDGDINTSLDWDESSYAFYYGDYTAYRSHPKVHYSEYGLMNITPSTYNWLVSDIRDITYKNTGATNGNFFYVDGSSSPGPVVALKFKDVTLCAGSKMYISAWVNNAGKATNPNLIFNVIARNGTEEYVTIASYTTGELLSDNTNRGVWRQIFFDFTVPDIYYDDYRLQIVNQTFATGGNDYLIDEVMVYVNKPMLDTYQANVSCSKETLESEEDMVMIMVDLSEYDFASETNSEKIYYQIQDYQGTAIAMNDYAGFYGTASNYGELTVSKAGNTQAYPIFVTTASQTALEQYSAIRNVYIANPASAPNPGNVFIESNVNALGRTVYTYYILHTSATAFNAGQTYQCEIVKSTLLFGQQTNCGMKSEFTMLPQSKLILNGEVGTSLVSEVVCANQFYEISVQMFGSTADLTKILPGSCVYDWLDGKDADYNVGGKFEGLDYDDILTALRLLREAYPQADDIALITPKDALQQSHIDLLKNLVNRGMLVLYKRTMNRRIVNGNTYCTVIPIAQTAVADDGTLLYVCGDPFVVTLRASELENNFAVGYNTEIGVPNEVYLANRIIRMSEAEANNSSWNIPICRIQSLTDQQFAKAEIYLEATSSDKSATLPFDNGTSKNILFSMVSPGESGGNNFLTLSGRHANLTLQQGHSYDFLILVPKDGSFDCNQGARFTIIVVPNQVMWTPNEGSNSWHRDINWTMIDATGEPVEIGNGYIPMAHTNVLIPHASAIPVLSETESIDEQTALILNDASTTNVEFDLNFIANTCQHIHIGSKAQLANQHLLNYDKAYVDITLPTRQWNLFSSPFKGMVTGDMFIPKSGTYVNPLFTNTDPADSRVAYNVFTSFFNSESYAKDIYGGTSPVSASQWTAPFNALSAPVNFTQGYSVKIYGQGEEEVTIRLPKSDTRYYYYGYDDRPTQFYENIERTETEQKLAGYNGEIIEVDFTNRFNSLQKTHLVANPFLYDLDIQKFMNDDYNKASINGGYAILSGADRSQIFNNVNLPVNMDNPWSEHIVPALTSFLVYIKDGVDNPKLRITPDMIKQRSDYSVSSTRSSRRNADSPTLRITAERNNALSHCYLVFDSEYDVAFNEFEDVELALLSAEMTPAAIYTHHNNVPMAINALSEINMVPLGYIIQDQADTNTLNISFFGTDNFNGSLTLLDMQTGITTPITSSTTLSLLELPNNANRYYLNYTPVASSIDLPQEDQLTIIVLQEQPGAVTLNASELMSDILIYTINGQLIAAQRNSDSYTATFQLPQGAYLFEVKTGNEISYHKVIVK